MAWYEAHQTLGKHPKTLKLARLIKRDRRYAVGMLHDLFCWGLDSAKKDGALPGMTAEDIAAALDFSGKTGEAVVSALVESGYLEIINGTFTIHDWYDYAGKLMDRREADKKRKSNGNLTEILRKSAGNPAEIREPSDGIPYATVPYSTVPNISGTIPRTRTREEEPEEEPENDLSRVMDFFMDRINPMPSPYCVESLKAYTASLGADVVIHACGVAIDERKTGWSYIQAILQRYERDGLKNMEAVLRAEQDFQSGKDKGSKPEKPSNIRGKATMQRTAEELGSLLAGLDTI